MKRKMRIPVYWVFFWVTTMVFGPAIRLILWTFILGEELEKGQPV
jgi:hypothetical protein